MLTHCGTQSINTERLLLRAFQSGDENDMLRYWASDPKIQAMYSEPVYSTLDEVKELLNKYILSYEKNNYYRWAVIEKQSNKCIGQIAVFLVDDKNHFCEIEYCIGSPFQRKGFCSEAAKAVIDFAFVNINVHKIQVCHKDFNVASKGVIEKCGFTYEGALRDYFYMDGKYVSRLYYSMLRDEWENGKYYMFYFKLMDQREAEEIANTWNYDGVYSFYNASADADDYEELITPEKRGDKYFSCYMDGGLIGFYCAEISEEYSAEIGIGMKPEHTGKGLGSSFVNAVLDHIVSLHKISTFTLSVALFNQRAVKVYKALGFTEKNIYIQKTNGSEYDFLRMEKCLMQSKEVLLLLTDKWADWEASYAIAEVNSVPQYAVKTIALDSKPKVSIGGLRAGIDLTVDCYKSFDSLAMLILPGGFSWGENRYDEIANFVKTVHDRGIPVAAICGATIFLAKHGFLDGVKHTGDEREYFMEELKDEAGYHGHDFFVPEKMVNDKGFITATETSALEFAKEIFRVLKIDTDEETESWYKKFKG